MAIAALTTNAMAQRNRKRRSVVVGEIKPTLAE
jgi:hypothetical protein